MRVLCQNNKHVNELISGALEDGGEGVILRKVGSEYEHGRTSSLIKLKISFVIPFVSFFTKNYCF